MKPAITLISGFLAYLFFEGFARLIISFYHRIDYSFYGVSSLPSVIWVIAILSSVLISTWLMAMLILTILDERIKFYAFFFLGIIICWRAIEIANSYHTEPLWYFVLLIGLHTTGVLLAINIYERQRKKINAS